MLKKIIVSLVLIFTNAQSSRPSNPPVELRAILQLPDHFYQSFNTINTLIPRVALAAIGTCAVIHSFSWFKSGFKNFKNAWAPAEKYKNENPVILRKRALIDGLIGLTALSVGYISIFRPNIFFRTSS